MIGDRDHGNRVKAARRHIVALTHKVLWPVALVTHVGHKTMVRDATHTLTSLTSCNYEPGYTMPLLECASGHADLAHMPDQARLDMRAGIEAFERRSPMHGMFESDRPVQRMRDDGYVTCHRNPHTPFPGKTSSIAVLIFECGRVVGTLTLAFFASAM